MKSHSRIELSEVNANFSALSTASCDLSFPYVNPMVEKHRSTPDDDGPAPTNDDASKTSSLSNPIFSLAIHQALGELLLYLSAVTEEEYGAIFARYFETSGKIFLTFVDVLHGLAYFSMVQVRTVVLVIQ